MKQPIAMRCNKKQFKAIKSKLLEISEIGMLLGAFKKYKYLTNNYRSGSKKIFDFVGNGSLWENEHQNNIHEEWNEKIFLEACGIETEKTFSITESQIKTIKEASLSKKPYDVSFYLKEYFPEAIESEVKLNAWYKWKGINETIGFVDRQCGGEDCFGFAYTIHGICEKDYDSLHISNLELATEQEVFEALKNEAVKRGFGDKIFIKRDFGKFFSEQAEINSHENPYEKFRYFMLHGGLENYGVTIFKNGKWAEIIPTITLSEAEQQLGKKIIV